MIDLSIGLMVFAVFLLGIAFGILVVIGVQLRFPDLKP